MSNNYNSALQSNNTDLQEVLQTLQTKASAAQATPIISVSSNGLITATAGTKSATKQLAFQAAKTITPTTTSQIAVSSGYYTGGAVTVKGDSNLVAANIKSGVSIFGVNGTYEGSGSGGNTDMEDGLVDKTVTNYTNYRVTSIGIYTFYHCSRLTSVNFPAVTHIANYAFQSCSRLTSVNFPAATHIGAYAFNQCSSLTSVSFPAATHIGYYIFQSCSRLTSVNFPVATIIGTCAFYQCYSLTSVSFPVATAIYDSAFYQCSRLTSVSFSRVTSIGAYAFCGCSRLTSISFPAATHIGAYAFYHGSSLTAISFPAVTTIDNNAFRSCPSLTSVNFPVATSIANYAFYGCYRLTKFYLTGSSLCKLAGSSAFSQTPIGGYSTAAGTYGSIYVPTSLLTSYKTATNWTYFSSRFVGV